MAKNQLTWGCESGSQKAGVQSIYPQVTAASRVPTFKDPSPALWAKNGRPLFPFATTRGVFTLNTASQFFLSSFTVQPALPYFRAVQEPDEIPQSICSECPSLVCDIVCKLRDLLESISAVALFFKSVFLCTFPVFPSYKTIFQRHFLHAANSVALVTVTSGSVNHCYSL